MYPFTRYSVALRKAHDLVVLILSESNLVVFPREMIMTFSILYFPWEKWLYQTSSGVFHGGAKVASLLKCRVLTSVLTLLVSCLSP